jgi:hypothetical protein
MADAYSAIKDECKKIELSAKRVDENVGSGIIVREITDFIERAEFINPFGFVAAAIDGVLGLARAAGLDLPSSRAEARKLE